MPTYADLWNEQQRALGQSGPSNPVRLTISKGDYVWDPHSSRFRYDEQWEEEHLMEDEELLDIDQSSTPSQLNASQVDSRETSPPPLTALQPTVLSGPSCGLQHQPSLWVLDTNTLMSCLELLKALFASLLTHNVAYAAGRHQQQQQHTHPSESPNRPSSIKLVIPHVVVSELDGLKITRQRDNSGRPVASQAREANHWLLSALQKQKRVTIDQADVPLAQDLWPLFVQPSSHYRHSQRANGGRSRWDLDDPVSCDDEMVSFCVQLKQQTASHVRFCSDDINARTKAERDDIDSLGMRELANALKLNFKDVESAQQKWMCVADALIEQWEYQIGSAATPAQHHRQLYDQQQTNANLDTLHSMPQVAMVTSGHSNASTHVLDAPGDHSPSMANNGILEVEMETEEPQQPNKGISPIPLTSTRPFGAQSRASPSYDGRSTNDSIHSPHSVRLADRTRPARPPPGTSYAIPTGPQGANTANGQSGDALNPRIDWESLVQQYGTHSRASNRQRSGRW